MPKNSKGDLIPFSDRTLHQIIDKRVACLCAFYNVRAQSVSIKVRALGAFSRGLLVLL